MVCLHRDNLTGEHPYGDIGQLSFFCIFMSLWISDFFLGYSNFLNDHVPLGARLLIGILLLIISGYLAKTGLSIVLKEETQSQGVFNAGVFRLVRHPIYMSEIILYLGLLIINMSLVATIIWVIAILFLHFISRHEEKLLIARFGEEYKQYMKEVGMWFPHVFRKKSGSDCI